MRISCRTDFDALLAAEQKFPTENDGERLVLTIERDGSSLELADADAIARIVEHDRRDLPFAEAVLGTRLVLVHLGSDAAPAARLLGLTYRRPGTVLEVVPRDPDSRGYRHHWLNVPLSEAARTTAAETGEHFAGKHDWKWIADRANLGYRLEEEFLDPSGRAIKPDAVAMGHLGDLICFEIQLRHADSATVRKRTEELRAVTGGGVQWTFALDFEPQMASDEPGLVFYARDRAPWRAGREANGWPLTVLKVTGRSVYCFGTEFAAGFLRFECFHRDQVDLSTANGYVPPHRPWPDSAVRKLFIAEWEGYLPDRLRM